jgi:hypothetical protein
MQVFGAVDVGTRSDAEFVNSLTFIFNNSNRILKGTGTGVARKLD